ncbi:5566_t:CDS:2, partial [Racocetra fulgida]
SDDSDLDDIIADKQDNEASSSSQQNNIPNAKAGYDSLSSISVNDSGSSQNTNLSSIISSYSEAKIGSDIAKDWYKIAVKDYKLKEIHFDEFEKMVRIGIGAYGTVYQTTYGLTREKVAIKELFITSDDYENIKIFINE